jgi:phosphate transport system substrate-binding protein
MNKIFKLASFTLIALFFSKNSQAFFLSKEEQKNRSYIHIVGSSTVSTFTSAIAEEYARNQYLKGTPVETPVVESIGTGEGFKIFCGGVGLKYPDFLDASRQINEKEVANCAHHGVKKMIEIKIGYDGIVIGNSTGAKKMNLTKEHIFSALAYKVFDKKSGEMILNPYKKWSEIDPSLPDSEIVFYGPPPTSGTRDVFVDILMDEVCFNDKDLIKAYKTFFKTDNLAKQQCQRIREDGRFIESGENDNLIIQNLKKNPQAVGIFGYNFLVANRKLVQPVKIEDVEPSPATITSKRYQLSRPLFIYFKKENLEVMPQMRDFIQEIISDDTMGAEGYLKNSGLVPLSAREFSNLRKNILLQLDEK